jgi:hypothetical protein
MKKKVMDRAQQVGYDPNEKKLVIALSDKMAARMQRDGWVVNNVEGTNFIVIEKNAP